MRTLIAALALSFCAQAAAQGMFKCRDAAGKITYAGDECAKLGLKPAGEVQERSSVAPAYKPPAPAARPKPAAAGKPPVPAAQQGAEAPPTREKRCFTVKTATGMATRCNDPAEETK